MKKNKVFIFGVALLNICTSISAFGEEMPKVIVNGNEISTEAIIKDSRTLIPVRGVFEELGFNVTWDDSTKTATLISPEYVIKIINGEDYILCNNEKVITDVPQQNIDNHFYIPLRSVAESVKAQVDWNADTRTATISTTKKVPAIIGEDKKLIGTNPKNGKPIYLVGGCEEFSDALGYSNGILVNGKRIWFDMSFEEAKKAIGIEPTYGDGATWGTFADTSIGDVQIQEENGILDFICLYGSDEYDVQYGKYLYTHMDGEKAAKEKLGNGEVSYSREPDLVVQDCNIRDSRGYTYIPITTWPNANASVLDIRKEIITFD